MPTDIDDLPLGPKCLTCRELLDDDDVREGRTRCHNGLCDDPIVIANRTSVDRAIGPERARELDEMSDDESDRWPCGELKDAGPGDEYGCPIHGAECGEDEEDEDEDE